jgi:hypothetical protein
VPTNPQYITAIHVHCNRPGALQEVELMGEKFQAVGQCCDKDGCNIEGFTFAGMTTTATTTKSSAAMSVFLSLSSACYAFVFVCLFVL